MWDFNIGQALGLLGRTLPFVLLRAAVYFGITLAYILATGAGIGVGWGVGAFGDDEFRATAMAWGGIAGFGLTGAVMYWLREYILYIVKAGHVAVLVELIDGKPLPEGRGQIAHATAVVKGRFGQASLLFALDQLVKGVHSRRHRPCARCIVHPADPLCPAVDGHCAGLPARGGGLHR